MALVCTGNGWRQLKSDISAIRPIPLHDDIFQDISAVEMSVFLEMVCLIDGLLHTIVLFDALQTVHFAREVVPTRQQVRSLVFGQERLESCVAHTVGLIVGTCIWALGERQMEIYQFCTLSFVLVLLLVLDCWADEDDDEDEGQVRHHHQAQNTLRQVILFLPIALTLSLIAFTVRHRRA